MLFSNKSLALIILMAILSPPITASQINIANIASNENSLEIIKKGLKLFPSSRHEAKITFSKKLNTMEVSSLGYKGRIDFLTLEGAYNAGDQQMSVFLGDVSRFDAPLEDVINAQLENYHKTAIVGIVNDFKIRYEAEKDPDKKIDYEIKIVGFQEALDSEVTWRSAKIIADYETLYNLSTSNEVIQSVLVKKENNAILFDMQSLNPERFKRSISEIRPHSKKNLPGSLRSLPGESSNLETTPSTHAAGLLCGSLPPDENFCPP